MTQPTTLADRTDADRVIAKAALELIAEARAALHLPKGAALSSVIAAVAEFERQWNALDTDVGGPFDDASYRAIGKSLIVTLAAIRRLGPQPPASAPAATPEPEPFKCPHCGYDRKQQWYCARCGLWPDKTYATTQPARPTGEEAETLTPAELEEVATWLEDGVCFGNEFAKARKLRAQATALAALRDLLNDALRFADNVAHRAAYHGEEDSDAIILADRIRAALDTRTEDSRSNGTTAGHDPDVLPQGMTFHGGELGAAYVAGAKSGRAHQPTDEQIARACDAYVKHAHLVRLTSTPTTT